MCGRVCGRDAQDEIESRAVRDAQEEIGVDKNVLAGGESAKCHCRGRAWPLACRIKEWPGPGSEAFRVWHFRFCALPARGL